MDRKYYGFQFASPPIEMRLTSEAPCFDPQIEYTQLRQEVYDWLDHHAGSRFEPSTGQSTWEWMLDSLETHAETYLFLFADPQVAMLFKLTWGGTSCSIE